MTEGHATRPLVSGDSCRGAQTCRGPVVPHMKHLTQPQMTEAELEALEKTTRSNLTSLHSGQTEAQS